MSSHVFLVAALLVGLPAASGQTMKPIASRDTPAHRTAVKFMRGVGFGNYLEYAAGSPAADSTYAPADYAFARAEGFDHIRIPVAWALYCGPEPDFTISPTIFQKVDDMLAKALAAGLNVIVDLHHFYDITGDVPSNTDKFYAIWRQVAEHFASAPSNLVFELLNEPNSRATTALMNPVYAEAIRQIRQTNPNRTIFVGPGEYNSANELSKLILPNDDDNLIVTLHCYDPYYFTHQGAEWAYPDTKTMGVLFPGPPETPLSPDKSIVHTWVLDWFKDYNRLPVDRNPSSPAAFKPLLQKAKNWSEFYGRPVHFGEFGCYSKAGPVSRVAFYRSIRESMDALGIGWAMWDFKSGFHYQVNGRPDPAGMREAIFPPIELQSTGKGSFGFPAAVGKTYVIEKSTSLASQATWQGVSTQTLATPQLNFTDGTFRGEAGFYRVRWLK